MAKKEEFYPRMIPVTGTTRQNDRNIQKGAGVNEIRCTSEEDHIRLNAADHAEMLEEQAGKPTGTAISMATEEAGLNERERCARIAESFGDEGRRIADAIRGVSVHQASVADQQHVGSGHKMVEQFNAKKTPPVRPPVAVQPEPATVAAAPDPLGE